MSLADAVSALRESALFGRIDDGRLKLIALTGETLRFRAGETLFERGDDGEAAFVIVSGRAEVRIPTDDGARTIAVLGRGELFGEIAALCERPRTASVIAADELVVLRIDRATLRRLLAEFNDLALELIRMMAGRLEKANLGLAGRAAGRSGD
jgi:CRP-like cAMP-binding protein